MFIMYIGIKFYISFMIFVLLFLAPPPPPPLHTRTHTYPFTQLSPFGLQPCSILCEFNHTESYLFYYTELLKR